MYDSINLILPITGNPVSVCGLAIGRHLLLPPEQGSYALCSEQVVTD